MEEIKNELKNIKTAISNIIQPYANLYEYLTLLETTGILIHDLVDSDPMVYANPYFEDFIISEITSLLGEHIEEFIPCNIFTTIRFFM